MKAFALSVVLAIAAGLSLQAGIGSLNLEAHEIGTGQIISHNWETDYGSFDRDYFQSKKILVTLRDLSRTTPRIGVHVYFIARPLDVNAELFIYNAQDFSVDMHGQLESVGEVGAPNLKSSVQSYAALGVAYGQGAVIDGWIVVGEVDGQRFRVRASRQGLLEIGEENPRQTQSLKKMIAAYTEATK